MKLSMWMIANRISTLDPELHLDEDAPICLRSARMAYATDCVHVCQSDADAVCHGIGGKIVLKDMGAPQAFELIQNVFDIYDDWLNGLLPITSPGDYQRIVDDSWLIFHNPIIFLDGDNKVLALSSQYAEDDINSEWQHLCRYGYSSLRYIQKFRRSYAQNDFYVKNKAQLFHFGPDLENSVTMSIAIYYDNLFCGRINILQQDRELNQGDIQLLELLASYLAPYLGALRYRQNQSSHQNIFQDLLLEHSLSNSQLQERLRWQTDYLNWQEEDTFQLLTLHHAENAYSRDLLVLSGNQIRKLLPEAVVLPMEDHIVLLYDKTRDSFETLYTRLHSYLQTNGFLMGISLPFRHLEKLRYYHKQALAAVTYGKTEGISASCYEFYHYALSYIIQVAEPQALLCACHPDILALAEEDAQSGGDRMLTLRTFLNMERSLLNTAKALYIHRNTLVYRINKIVDGLQYDIEDGYCRDYMKMTFRIMQLYPQERE